VTLEPFMIFAAPAKKIIIIKKTQAATIHGFHARM